MRKSLLLAAALLWSGTAWLQLSGTYTIDPSVAAGGTNYQTFNAFASDLGTQGVSGAVTVNVKEGTYTESVTFGNHIGNSAANLVTIQSDPTNTNPVLLTYASTSSSEATIILTGAKHFKFDGLNIENTGSSSSRVIYIQAGCGDIEFSNNNIEGPLQSNSTSTFYSLIYGASVAPVGVFDFNNNTFLNGSHVAYVTSSTSARIPKVDFKNNTASGFSGYGLYFTYVDSLIAHNNELRQASSSGTYYGVRGFNSTTSHGAYASIVGNEFYASTSSTVYGVYLNYYNNSGDRGEVINNMISNSGNGTGTRYGFYMQANANINFWHNSISIPDGSTTSGRSAYFTGSTSSSVTYTQGGYDVRNNIFSNTGGGLAIEVTNTAITHFTELDYNVYNYNGTAPFEWDGTTYADLTAWQTGTSYDPNSLAGDPLFTGADDLHLVGTLANDVGANVGVTVDIDGEARPQAPSTSVDIGADEYTPSSCVPPTDLTVSNISFDQVDLGWTVNGTETAWNIEVVAAGATPSGSGTAVTTNPYTVTGLTGSTDYDFYVQADCGGSTSSWSGPFTFTTACSPVVAPWVDNLTGTSTPACWSQETTSGGPWLFESTGFPSPGYSASNVTDHTNGVPNNFAWMDFSGSDAGVILQTPLIDVSALNVPELRFWVWSHYDQGLSPMNELHVEANDGTTWQPLLLVQGDFGPQWTEFKVIIPPALYMTSTLVSLRFRAEEGGGNPDYYNDILLDDVSVTEAPTCPAPTDFMVDGSTLDSVMLSWTVVGPENEWEVEYGNFGFTQGSGTVEFTNTNPDTIAGLAPYQFYHVYLRAVCTPGDTSELVGPIEFNTFDQGQYMEAGTDCGPGFIDISQTGVDLNLGDDDEAGYVLPFAWLVQGERVDRILVGNNGGVLLNTIQGNVFTTMNSGDGFYPFVLDLDSDTNGIEIPGVFWEVFGTAPNRQYVIMWKDRSRYSGSNNPNPCTFEMIFNESTGEVWYTYPDTDFGNPNYDFGADAEIGFRGNQDITISINDPQYLMENECVHLYYTDCPKPTDLVTAYVTPDEAAFTWSAGLSNETNWMVKYGPAGFDPQTGGVTQTVTTTQAIISGLEELTEYDICIYALCANGDTSRSVCTTFKTLPLCSDVSALNGDTGVDSLMVEWNWTASSPQYEATGFDTYYGPLGYDPATSGWIYNGDTTNNMDTIENAALLAGGVYDVYVQSVCDTLRSNLVGPITLVMPLTNDSVCGAETLPVDDMPYFFNNSDATVQSGENAIAPQVTGPQETDGWKNNQIDFTTWFKFTAPASGQIRISGVDLEFDGQIAIYELTDCSDFGTFQLVAANDDEIGGSSEAPNFTYCNLTPGNEYYLMHDALSASNPGNYAIRLKELDLEAGTTAGVIDICSRDTVSLFSAVSGYDNGGMWLDLENTFHIVDDSLFNTVGLAYETYQFEYRLEDGCAMDSIVAEYKIFPPSSAGEDGSLTVCKNQPIGLLGALSGVINAGGTWYNASNTALPNDFIPVGTFAVAGGYTYRYVVGNDVCPDDTSIVTVIVQGGCDFLGVEELTSDVLNVYPNPNNGEVTVEYADMLKIKNVTVVDMRGREIEVPMHAGENQMQLDLKLQANGVYVLRLEGEDFTLYKRIVKQ